VPAIQFSGKRWSLSRWGCVGLVAGSVFVLWLVVTTVFLTCAPSCDTWPLPAAFLITIVVIAAIDAAIVARLNRP